MIIGTTSMKHVLDSMDLISCFNVCLKVPNIQEDTEVHGVLKNFAADDDVLNAISESVYNEYCLIGMGGVCIKNLILAAHITL